MLVLLLGLKQTERLERVGVVTQCWFSYCDYSKPTSWNERVMLDNAGSLIEIKARQAAGTRTGCYTVLVPSQL